MSERLKRLIDERNRVVGEIREVFDVADKDNKGILNGEQDGKIKALESRDEELYKQIESEERQVARERALKSVATGSEPVVIAANSGDVVTEKRTKLHDKAFRTWLIDGSAAMHHPEFRDLQAGVLVQGGSFVAPQQWINKLIQAVDNIVRVRQYATIINMDKAMSLGVPTLDSNPDDADWTVELATGTNDTGMKTGKREFSPSPIAKKIKVSNKLLQVSSIPIEDLVSNRFTYKFGVTQEKAFLTGTGANQPLGIYTASADGISTARDVSTGNTTTAVTFDGLIEAFYSLKEQYQANAVWNFHRLGLKNIRQLKDLENRYIWAPGGTPGQPDSLLGRPMFMSEYTPNTFTTGKYVGCVGDFSNYWIAQVLGMQLQRLNELYAESNQVGWIGRMELDGMPVLEEAFARVTLS